MKTPDSNSTDTLSENICLSFHYFFIAPVFPTIYKDKVKI